ncbi:Dabb family protein, partial [bacterium]
RDKLLSMEGRISQIRHLEVGADIVRSERSFDLALLTRFDSLEDLQTYQIHPYHAEVIVPYVRSISSAIAAVDYESCRAS